jgi:serine/threonine-protein kinase
MSTSTEQPETEAELWLVCPVCKQPNPADVLHCRHCWGASLHPVSPVTSEQLAIIMEQNAARDRRRRTIKTIGVSIIAPLMLFAVVFWAIYSFTDLVMAPSLTLNSSPLPGEWTMFRHDLGRTGSTGLGGSQPVGTLKWSFTTDAPIQSSPTVVDNTVYFGSQDFNLYALDTDTGSIRWKFKTGSFVDSSPTVVGGVVYFGSNDGYFYALDAKTGKEFWKFSTGQRIKSSAAVADGMVFFGSNNYSLYALDARTGERIWRHRTRGYVLASPAVANGIIYFGSMDNSFYALQASNGRFRLLYKANEMQSSPAVKDGVVYFNSAGRLHAIDGSDRNWPGEHSLRGHWFQLWAFRIAPMPPPLSGKMWSFPLGESSPTSPIVIDNTIYTTADNKLVRIDIDKIDFSRVATMRRIPDFLEYIDSELGWVYEGTQETYRSSPTLGDNVIYIGGADGIVHAVDATSGEQLWSYDTGAKINSSPALDNGILYITSENGTIYALE